jgi:hypothetical protein
MIDVIHRTLPQSVVLRQIVPVVYIAARLSQQLNR